MSEKDEPPRIVIARVGKRANLSKQTEKDQELTASRVRRNGAALNMVVARLEILYGPSLQKKDLLVVARRFTQVTLDRLAKRSRDCLLCWFCENWGVLEPLLFGACSPQPRVNEFDPRNSCPCAPPDDKMPDNSTLFGKVDDFDLTDFGYGSFGSALGTEGGFEFFTVL
jgi:hypothetical protein